MNNREKPFLAVDVVIKTGDGLVLVRRKNDPEKGKWAIPGGFMEYGETVENAALREAKEETGLEVILKDLVGVFSDPDRDPRGHIVSICYLAEREGGVLHPSSDAEDVKVFKEIPWNKLAFDHEEILRKIELR